MHARITPVHEACATSDGRYKFLSTLRIGWLTLSRLNLRIGYNITIRYIITPLKYLRFIDTGKSTITDNVFAPLNSRSTAKQLIRIILHQV